MVGYAQVARQERIDVCAGGAAVRTLFQHPAGVMGSVDPDEEAKSFVNHK